MKYLNNTKMLGCYCIALILSLISCNSESNKSKVLPKQSFVYQPFENVRIEPQTYQIDPNKDNVIKLENGTRINIEANTLVDKDNRPIKDSVFVKYSEFHNAEDILLSGIPMEYDSAGNKYIFESAGMFDINAVSANNDPIYIKEGKSINVQMASYKSDNNYSFYYLDTIKKNWEYKGIAQASENLEKQNKLKENNERQKQIETEQKKLFNPTAYSSEDEIINFDIDYSIFKELKCFQAIVWRHVKSKESLDQVNQKLIYKEKWENISLNRSLEEGIYELELKKKDKKIKMLIEPLLRGNDLKKAKKIFQEKYNTYANIAVQIQNERARVEKEADLLRSFDVNKFGIHNWDRYIKDDDVFFVKANFKFDNDYANAENITIYQIIKNKNTVIKYNNYYKSRFMYTLNDESKLIAILPDNKIAFLSDNDIRSLMSLRTKNDTTILNITLKSKDIKLESNAELSNLLNNI